MSTSWVLLAVVGLAVASGLPAHDDVLAKLDPGPRYQYVEGPDGIHLEDMWLKISDLKDSEDYNPDRDNVYHLFTRANPSISQPLLPGFTQALRDSNYSSRRRTIILIHGWRNVATSDFNALLVPAFLAAEDVNVFIADWSIGAAGNYLASLLNAIRSGLSVSSFITWLNTNSGSNLSQYHIVGHSLGGHQAGIVGRHLNGVVPYITSLDPALPGWITNPNRFQSDDGLYTEVIHTNAGLQGFLSPIGQVDIYPNGGNTMPGCDTSSCHHHRCNFYMAESLISGGFTSRRCATLAQALIGDCTLPETLQLGGIHPKPGATGMYYVATNAGPPFSKG